MYNLTISNTFGDFEPVNETVDSISRAVDRAEYWFDQYDGNAEFLLISATGIDDSHLLHIELSERENEREYGECNSAENLAAYRADMRLSAYLENS